MQRVTHGLPLPGTLGPVLLFALAGSGCASPAPLDPPELARAVAARATDPATLSRALDLAGLLPLDLEMPRPSDDDPDGASFWHARAWAWAREPATARHRYLALLEARDAAGQPGPLRLGAEALDLAGAGWQADVRQTFDLLGVLGLGRSAAAWRLADARARRALGEVEQALWRARFAVDRARVRVAAARARRATLGPLLAEVGTGNRRIAILAQRGWIPEGPVHTARAMTERLRRRLTIESAVLADALAQLSAAAGVPPGTAALAQVSPATLDRFAPAAPLVPAPSATELLTTHPDLRVRLLEYAVAEARVRRAAAEAWPEIGLGPRLRIEPDVLLGGVLGISLPWPGTVASRVRQALAQRDAERVRAEDALVRAQAAVARTRARLLAARRTLEEHGPAIESGTRSAWRAARARFGVDAGTLPAWNDSLERRIDGAVAAIDAREQAILALIDYLEAVGPNRDLRP